MARTTYDEIITLLVAKGGALKSTANELLPPLQAVEKITPEVLPLSVQYMITGSALAQEIAAREFNMLLLGINQNKERTTKAWQTHEDIYREQLTYYTDLPMTAQMHLGWNFNNIASEMGMRRYEVDRYIHHAVSNCAKVAPNEDHDEVYWRGVAALHLACRYTTLPELDQHDEFIQWAGSSDNVLPIITLAQERNILAVEQLRALMGEQESILPNLRDGVL